MNRKDINDILKLLPISSSIIGPPRKAAALEAYLKKEPNAGYMIKSSHLDLSSETKDFPAFFQSNSLASTYTLYIAVLNSARVWGRNGTVIGSGDYFINDVSREFNEELSVEHSVFYTLKQVKSRFIKGNVAVVGTAGANVYFHWMLDILPRLALLAKSISLDSIDYFITEFSQKSYQQETLDKIGVRSEKIIASNDNWNFHIKAEKLWVPSLPGPFLQPDLFQIEFLRALYKNEISSKAAHRKIYISRKKTGFREIVNEKELLSILIAMNFEVLYCEEMTVAQQVTLFSEALVVIGSHGSALTNITFCKPGTSVIDLFNQSHFNSCFWFISRIVGLNYYYLSGKSCPQDRNKKNDNTLVDISEFRKALREIGLF